MTKLILKTLFLLSLTMTHAWAFCGFYVAKADSSLYNSASKVVLARHEDKTVITMVNDYKGELNEFAIVVPVPTVLERGQIHVTENKIVDHLDAYTAPRLVEYFDKNPCQQMHVMSMSTKRSNVAMDLSAVQQKAKALGVVIEAEYTVGEYDILILSAKESNGLIKWLKGNDYRLPKGSEKVVASYLKKGMKFFVAKVNLEEQVKGGREFLRPLQMAFESEQFMLPIRLGMLNADGGQQELLVYTLTKSGRVEAQNYRTIKMPTAMDVPLFVKEDFAKFYLDMFSSEVKRANNKAVFLEYAWNMNWCDPCAADPLSPEELKELGVFWLAAPQKPMPLRSGPVRPIPMRIMPPQQARDVYVTRLHVRYDKENFPEDLAFKITNNRQNFQARYILRHPWTGEKKCEAADQYLQQLPKRFEQEAQTLARLTGWEINEIRRKMKRDKQDYTPPKPVKWWDSLWN